MAASAPGPRGLRATIAAGRSLLDDPCPALDTLASRYGRTFALRIGPQEFVIVGDRGHVRDVLGADPAAYRWRPAFRNLAIVIGRTALIVTDGEAHRSRRRLVQPAFARRRLDHWMHLIIDTVDETLEALPVGTPIDLEPVIRQTVRRIVLRVLFGADLSILGDDIGALLEPAVAYTNEPLLRQLPHPVPFSARARARSARRRVDDLLAVEIAHRRATTREAARDNADMLDVLIDAGLTSEEIYDQVVALTVAGYDTTTAAISWCLLRTMRDAALWERLRQEADDAARDSTELRLTDLPLAHATAQETLRLHPPGAVVPRRKVAPGAIGPYRVRRGAMVLYSPYLLGRDPASWAEPLAFRPDRFLDPETPVLQDAWVPFGSGPRQCIGFGLAMMQLATVLARCAQRITFAPVTGPVPRPVGAITSHPEGGVPVAIARRRGARESR